MELSVNCSNFQLQINGDDKAISSLCEKEDNCDPKTMFKFVGDVKANEYVPFQIDFVTEPIDDYTLFNETTIPCYQAVNVSSSRFKCN